MKPIQSFTVVPSLPPALESLRGLAYNLRWAWNPDTISLFRRLDDDLWEASGHNPVLMLGTIDQARLEAAMADEGFLAQLERVAQDLESYQANRTTWYKRSHADSPSPLAAYFSAEFGLTESLSIFAGGLGLLAGDHLKSASDLDVPLVGIGLLYQQGYFHQQLNAAGWQQETYTDNDFYNLPVELEQASGGGPLIIPVAYPGRSVSAQVWRAQVGRLKLYLLDSNLASNNPDDQNITDQLYGGDLDLRLKQEILLGIGGYRALEAMGIQPPVYHMNEGHAAFLSLEHVRHLMDVSGLPFAAAREAASASLVFTTHTPVPAGHDHFTPEMMDRYFGDYARGLGLSRSEFLGLGRENPADETETFSMTVLALKMAAYSNGVSRLHGEVSRQMWQGLWPGVPVDEIPIGHVTNGVHFRSWVSNEMDELYDRYLGPRWVDEPADQTIWERVKHIPAEELWRTHERRRERLVAFSRKRMVQQAMQHNASHADIQAAEEVLDPKALTIGFARRFATYKRATLLLKDPQRLERLMNDPQRPVQFIFSGKAHPRDDPGKELIRQIVTFARQENFQRRMIFLENYDTAVARYLVQGADVWLNTPRRPLEASGTSGMKAMANGGLNLSVLDGWWDEAWTNSSPDSEPIGWAIGGGETYNDEAFQDQLEADTLFDLLERDVVPTFYEHGSDGLPRRWIARMKASISSLSHYFNTHRMVKEYTECFYLPAAERFQKLSEDKLSGSKALADWKACVRKEWRQVAIIRVDKPGLAEIKVGDTITIHASVRLGALAPDDVRVELFSGRISGEGEIVEDRTTPMKPVSADADGSTCYEAKNVPCATSGLRGYTVRVMPWHPDLVSPFMPGLIAWA